MKKFFEQQTSYESLINALVLQSNNLIDTDFAGILEGLQKNSQLRHLHYGMNELSFKGNKALQNLL